MPSITCRTARPACGRSPPTAAAATTSSPRRSPRRYAPAAGEVAVCQRIIGVRVAADALGVVIPEYSPTTSSSIDVDREHVAHPFADGARERPAHASRSSATSGHDRIRARRCRSRDRRPGWATTVSTGTSACAGLLPSAGVAKLALFVPPPSCASARTESNPAPPLPKLFVWKLPAASLKPWR